ncbi:MAG: cyclic pyranopterin monophosphate synthase MoaC [Elusimicrobia bacterium]|nr:MAG: cyclic pyranopterin monophosphate synthase MoaC [Elusimicrobiota bacterium]
MAVHVNRRGEAWMVDVGGKAVTRREAVAFGRVTMSRAAARVLRSGKLKKGDALAAARLAGIQAAKRTSEWIPLCHPLALDHVEVRLTTRIDGVCVEATVRTSGRTGVEMEALTAVSAACLTLYDMLKSEDRAMIIGPIRLEKKSGGRSGDYRRKK